MTKHFSTSPSPYHLLPLCTLLHWGCHSSTYSGHRFHRTRFCNKIWLPKRIWFQCIHEPWFPHYYPRLYTVTLSHSFFNPTDFHKGFRLKGTKYNWPSLCTGFIFQPFKVDWNIFLGNIIMAGCGVKGSYLVTFCG